MLNPPFARKESLPRDAADEPDERNATRETTRETARGVHKKTRARDGRTDERARPPVDD
jgi:hypothetical protein